MSAQEPPARRSARLVAVAAQRAGPSYALPGQAAPTASRGQAKQYGSELNRRTSPKWVRIHPALTALIADDVCRRALTPVGSDGGAAIRAVLDAWVQMIAGGARGGCAHITHGP